MFVLMPPILHRCAGDFWLFLSQIAVKSCCGGSILAKVADSLTLSREEGFVLIKEHSVPGFCKGNLKDWLLWCPEQPLPLCGLLSSASANS